MNVCTSNKSLQFCLTHSQLNRCINKMKTNLLSFLATMVIFIENVKLLIKLFQTIPSSSQYDKIWVTLVWKQTIVYKLRMKRKYAKKRLPSTSSHSSSLSSLSSSSSSCLIFFLMGESFLAFVSSFRGVICKPLKSGGKKKQKYSLLVWDHQPTSESTWTTLWCQRLYIRFPQLNSPTENSSTKDIIYSNKMF